MAFPSTPLSSFGGIFLQQHKFANFKGNYSYHFGDFYIKYICISEEEIRGVFDDKGAWWPGG